MSNVIPFDTSGMPAHIAAQFGDVGVNNDLTANALGGGFPVISYKGKVWHVVRGEERILIADEHGDPRASIEVVLLKANSNLSKIYFRDGYEEGSSDKPTCYSYDGVVPALDAQERQSRSCAACPHSVWGSKITEQGSKGKACADSRRVAVAPVADLENPMLLRIPAATLKELANYGETLNRRRAPYAAVVTKIGFDHSVAHPRMTFKAIRWLTPQEAELVGQVLERDVINNIIGVSQHPETGEVDALGDAPEHVKVLDKPAPKPVPKPVVVPKARAKHEVSEAEIDEALGNGFADVGGGTRRASTASAATAEATVSGGSTPAGSAAKSAQKFSALVAEADASLDEALRMLDD